MQGVKMNPTIQLAPAEITHLLNILHDTEKRGEYYGNKEHYWKRNTRIVGKLKDSLKIKEKHQ